MNKKNEPVDDTLAELVDVVMSANGKLQKIDFILFFGKEKGPALWSSYRIIGLVKFWQQCSTYQKSDFVKMCNSVAGTDEKLTLIYHLYRDMVSIQARAGGSSSYGDTLFIVWGHDNKTLKQTMEALIGIREYEISIKDFIENMTPHASTR